MIQRDSLQTSLWQDSVEKFTGSNIAGHELLYDVIIVGGGITGVTTALELQRAGKNCLLIEAANLCFGTTGGTTAHLNTLLDTPYNTIADKFGADGAKLVARATADAIQLVKDNISRYNIECGFEDTPAYLYALNSKQDKELDDIFKASADAGLRVSYTNELPVPDKFTRVMRVEGQAKFNPVYYVYALAKAFEQAGGVILQHTRVTGVTENEPLEVATSNGNFKADRLIYATHVPPGVNLLHLRCAPYRSYAMAMKLANDTYPDGLTYDMNDPYYYYRTQVIEGERYLIVGGEDHKTGHEENTNKCFQQLEARIRSMFDVAEITHRWSSQYFEPADGIPYIGHLPQHSDRIFVASGYGGNGITYSHVAANVLRELIINDVAPYENIFKPGRIKPVAGFVNFITHNADVARLFVGKLFSAEKLQGLSDLAPGEGRIVKFEGQKLGISKATDGSIHAVNPVCTHMHCDVAWNMAEQSWDCPCHGGRFDCHGKVLTGPPSIDLEPVSIEQLMEKSK